MSITPGPWLPAPGAVVEPVEFAWGFSYVATEATTPPHLWPYPIAYQLPSTPRGRTTRLEPIQDPGYVSARIGVRENWQGVETNVWISHFFLSEYLPAPWEPQEWPEGAISFEVDGSPAIDSSVTVSGSITGTSLRQTPTDAVPFDGRMTLATGWTRPEPWLVGFPETTWVDLAGWPVLGSAHVDASSGGIDASDPEGTALETTSPAALFTTTVAPDTYTVLGLMPSILTTPNSPPFAFDQYGFGTTYLADCQLIEAHATIARPRYRFLFEEPDTKGMWRLRQRQSLPGADGWPLRQRQNGGATGSWPLRQRQSGA